MKEIIGTIIVIIVVITIYFSFCSGTEKKHEYLGKIKTERIVTFDNSLSAKEQLDKNFADKFKKLNALYIDQSLKALLKDDNFKETRVSLRNRFDELTDQLWAEYDEKSALIAEKGKDFIEEK